MKFPEYIEHLLRGYETSGENHRTSSEAEVYLYQRQGAVDLFLKIGSGDVDEPLVNEKNAMVWLGGKLPVPRVVGYCEAGGKEYLVTEHIGGMSSHECRDDKAQTVRILAEGLRAIHAVDLDGCPFPVKSSEVLIAEAERNVADGVVTDDDLVRYKDERTLNEALAEVRALKPGRGEMVLIHGDYCLPNIMIDEGKLSGFIDWGSVGVGDRHLDFAAVEYSVRRNLGEEWVAPFFDVYGREYLNEDVMAFYRAIYALA